MSIQKLITLSEPEADELQAQADQYTDGNASAQVRRLIRLAAPRTEQELLARHGIRMGRPKNDTNDTHQQIDDRESWQT